MRQSSRDKARKELAAEPERADLEDERDVEVIEAERVKLDELVEAVAEAVSEELSEQRELIDVSEDVSEIITEYVEENPFRDPKASDLTLDPKHLGPSEFPQRDDSDSGQDLADVLRRARPERRVAVSLQQEIIEQYERLKTALAVKDTGNEIEPLIYADTESEYRVVDE